MPLIFAQVHYRALHWIQSEKLCQLADLRRVEVDGAFDAWRESGENDARISFEALRPSVDDRYDGAHLQSAIVVVVEKADLAQS
jgi:hypothetical protein